LDEDRADFRVDAHGQVVDDDLPDEHGDLFDAVALGPRGQGMQIGNDEEGVVLVLQLDAVDQAADVVAQVQPASGPVAGEQAGLASVHAMAPTVAAQQRAAPEKQNPLWSKGTRGDSRGATQVRPWLPRQQKNLPVIATGFGRPASLCGYARRQERRLIP